jgi:glutamine synthetase
MHMSRFILCRIAEDFGITISFAPKLFEGWAGAGGHINFSTKTMRNGSKGWKYIDKIMERLEDKHELHMSLYGEDNHLRMTGLHETAEMEEFSYGVGNRAASIRIPTETAHAQGAGYIEDRRPGSNLEPYLTCALFYDTCVYEKTNAKPMLDHYYNWVEERKE